METALPLKALLVADGSGGHLIPALQLAQALAGSGGRVRVWYALRRQTAPLAQALAQNAASPSIEMEPIPIDGVRGLPAKLARCGRLWRQAHRCFDTFAPDAVVGFGGWVSAPVLMAARWRGVSCMVHEQNAVLGRANRWLARWVDRVAVSFPGTQRALADGSAVVTGLPVRSGIGDVSRAQGAGQFELDPNRFTILVLGGSQGSRAVNRVMTDVAAQLSADERRSWQVLHLAGAGEDVPVRAAYETAALTARVAPFLADMSTAFAAADVVVARAGASTLAELARCGLPAVLIPFQGASGHQRANARAVEFSGGGFVLDETEATPQRVGNALRWLAADVQLRRAMGAQMRLLNQPNAAERLAEAVTQIVRAHHTRHPSAMPAPSVG